MRPLKLTISAFGPYSTKQIIDFENLQDKKIFLISGDTGAGKTTIFDSIMYALYGSASGESRDVEFLRSHFANEETETFVELEFLLKNKRYIVKRSPMQDAKRKRSEGVKIVKATAFLTMPDGKVIEKATVVTEKITELLGINKDQFRQIVMLPQGEFKSFILSPSDEREKIFRNIFKTDYFALVQKHLKEELKSVREKREALKIELEMNLKSLDDYLVINENKELNEDIISNIESLLNNHKENKLKTVDNLKEIEKSIKSLEKKCTEIKQQNETILEKEKAYLEYKNYLKEEENFESKEILAECLKVKELVPLESNIRKLENSLESKKEKNNILLMELESIGVKYREKCELYEKELENEVKRKAVSDEIVILEAMKGKISEIENLTLRLSEEEEKGQELKKKLNNLNEELKKKNGVKQESEELVKIAKEDKIKKLELIKSRREARIIVEKIEGFEKNISHLKNLNNEEVRIKDEIGSAEKTFKRFRREYNEMDDLYRSELAGVLAMDLEEGKECPVCGSKEHPNKAKIKNDVKPLTEEQLKIKKNKLENKREKLEKLMIEHKEIKREEELVKVLVLKEIEDILAEKRELDKKTISKIRIILENKRVEIIELNEELDLIKDDLNIESKEEKIQCLKREIESLEEEKEELTLDINKCFGEVKSIKGNLEILNGGVIDGINSKNELESMIYDKKSILEFNRAILEKAKTEKESLDKEITLKEVQLEEVEKSVEALIKELNVEGLGLKEVKDNLNLDTKFEYEYLKNQIVNLEKIAKDISEYENFRDRLKGRYEALSLKCKNYEKIDAEELVLEIEEKEAIKKNLLEKSEMISSLIDRISRVLKKSKKSYLEFKEINKYFQNLKDVSDLANGNKSPNISFERYVLRVYFDLIIENANKTFRKITNDRYILKRLEKRSKGKGQKGLELEVYDRYTGRSREASTLSGGECFKASLALALGLSETVQSTLGGIELDTIFIDEGFGTLDPKSLDDAIDCLLELKESGRLVGVISHVEELKNRIYDRLEIKGDRYGSKATFKIM